MACNRPPLVRLPDGRQACDAAAKRDSGRFARRCGMARTSSASTAMDAAGLKFTDRMSLSTDGKVLTSKVQIATPQGEAELNIVFKPPIGDTIRASADRVNCAFGRTALQHIGKGLAAFGECQRH